MDTIVLISFLFLISLFIWMVYTSIKKHNCKHIFKKDIGQRWYHCEKCGETNWRE